VINGLAVACGVGVVLFLATWLGGAEAAWLAGSGAACVSLADAPGTPKRVAWSVLGAGVLSVVATVVALLTPPGWVTALGVGGMAFVALMALAWGPRAGPLSFAPILAMVFAFGHAKDQTSVSVMLAWTVLGMWVFLWWSVLCAWVLQPLYRRRALVAALRTMGALLHSRAEVLGHGHSVRALAELIGIETLLATRLQAARDLVFAQHPSARARRQAALLLRIIDLRDALLASRLDLELLGSDAAGQWLRERLAAALRTLAVPLLGDRHTPAAAAELSAAVRRHFEGSPLAPTDVRIRLQELLLHRLQNLADEVARLQLLRREGQEEVLPLSPAELQLFVTPEAFPLAALEPHRSLASPVLRHALRTALALACAYLIAHMLPWRAHPHWLLLSVAVVLRGNLEQTLSRRNARVLGTTLGCLLVLLLSKVHTPWLLQGAFLLAIAVAHASFGVRYWVTAACATVMALLQAQVTPGGTGLAVVERLADTVLGALLALAFSYVLPAWERRTVPHAARRTLQALAHYARQALVTGVPPSPAQGLARRAAYDALASLAAATQRSTVEPRHVQLPITELSNLLDHGQQLMAHLSALRAVLIRRAADLPAGAQVQMALSQSLRSLMDSLNAAAVPAEAPDAVVHAAALADLPMQPPEQDPWPWLQRRLLVAEREGRRVGRAAATALQSLR